MKRPVNIKLFIMGVALLGAVLVFQTFGKSQRYRETKSLMGTIVQVDTCLTKGNRQVVKQAYEKIWERMGDIAWRMSVFEEDSEITRLNNAFPQAIKVQSDTYQVIEDAVGYTYRTKEAFDITVMPLITLWKESARAQHVPPDALVRRVRQYVGSRNINLLPGEMVGLSSLRVKVDLGGIAKGYAVDEAARIFREHHINDFFIDAGGDVYAGGHNCRRASWRVGIRDPRDKDKIAGVIRLSDAAVTTSGNYEQYYDIRGRRYSHIIDPRTGYPQEEVVSATVIARTATGADAVSTALCVLGSKEGIPLVESFGDDFAAVIMTIEGEKTFTTAFTQNYKKYKLR